MHKTCKCIAMLDEIVASVECVRGGSEFLLHSNLIYLPLTEGLNSNSQINRIHTDIDEITI